MTPAAPAANNRVRVLLAFAAVYLVWGSVYLATRFAVEHIPAFVMGAVRMLSAGLMLYAASRWRGAPAPTGAEWRASARSGILMLGMGNGAVVYAAQTVDSGLIALIVASVPIWMVLADWWRPRGVRPGAPVLMGLALGLLGMVILIGPSIASGGVRVNPVGVIALLIGSVSWAIGSIITRHRERPKSALVSVAIQMIAAGLWFALAAVLLGEFPLFSLDRLTTRSVISWVYLIIGGSLIGYTAYVYLLGAVSAAKAATYAYVNPVIALILGWAFAGEAMTARMIGAAAVILAGVAIITTTGGPPSEVTGEHPAPAPSPTTQRSGA